MAIPDINDTYPVAPLENLFNLIGDGAEAEIAALAASVGRGSRAIYSVTNPAALSAISNAIVGDLAWMTAPGTGITPLYWKAFAGSGTGIDWSPLGNINAASLANLDAFIAVIAADPDTRFVVGSLATVAATDARYRFTSDAGAKILWSVPTANFVPTLTNITLGTGGTNTARVSVQDGWVKAQGIIILGTAGMAVGTGPTISLPYTATPLGGSLNGVATPIGSVQFADTPTRGHPGAIVLLNSGTVASFQVWNTSLAQVSAAFASATTPFTWGANDQFQYEYEYEIA